MVGELHHGTMTGKAGQRPVRRPGPVAQKRLLGWLPETLVDVTVASTRGSRLAAAHRCYALCNVLQNAFLDTVPTILVKGLGAELRPHPQEHSPESQI